MPKAWPAAFTKIKQAADPATTAQAMALAVTFGDASAVEGMRSLLADQSAPGDQRQSALAALLKVRDPKLAPTLQSLLADSGLRAAALRGLAQFDDPATPAAILKVYPTLNSLEKRDALATLGARVDYAQALLDSVANKQIAAADLSADLVRQLHNLKNASLDQKINDVWGTVRDTAEDKAEAITHYKKLISNRSRQRPDVSLGAHHVCQDVSAMPHAVRHRGKVGPELTGSNRANLDYVLANVLDSSALVGKDYQTTVISTTDGRVLTGIVRGDDNDAVTLVTANETVIVPKAKSTSAR